MTRLETAATVLFILLAVVLVALLGLTGRWIRDKTLPPATIVVTATVTANR